MLDTSIQIKTEKFDGPLALLLLLIQKEEMDIRSLDLTVITGQYLNYLGNMKELNFDVAGDYLYLATSLILIKSRACISEEEDKNLLTEEEGSLITSQAELIRRLEELERYQKLGKKLWALPKKGHETFIKPKVNRKEIVDSILTPMDLEKLTMSMIDLIQKSKRQFTLVKKDRFSMKKKLVFLKTFLQRGQKTNFSEIVENDGDQGIGNTVVSFISLLELARLKKVRIFQGESLGKIYIDVLESLENFEIDSANGFEDENKTEENENETAREEIPSLDSTTFTNTNPH